VMPNCSKIMRARGFFKMGGWFCSWLCPSSVSRLSVWDQEFDYGRIVNWKTDSPKRMLGACQNLLVIGPVSAERFMTAASTWRRSARSAVLNAPCAVQLSRIGTLLGFLDIVSSPVQLGRRTTNHSKRPRDPEPARRYPHRFLTIAFLSCYSCK